MAADVSPAPGGPCSRRFLGGLREPAQKILEADAEDGGAGDTSGAGCEFQVAFCRRTPIGGSVMNRTSVAAGTTETVPRPELRWNRH